MPERDFGLDGPSVGYSSRNPVFRSSDRQIKQDWTGEFQKGMSSSSKGRPSGSGS